MNKFKSKFLLVLFIGSSSAMLAQRETLAEIYSDTSFTYKVISKMLKNYDNVNGKLCYEMNMRQYDSSQQNLLDSSFSKVCYSGREVRMEQKYDIIITLDTAIFYLNHSQKIAFYRAKPKGGKDMEYSSNPMAFILKFYKERKLKMRKLTEDAHTYVYSVDFDFQKNMYLVTTDKKTDYIQKVVINYFVPDAANLVNTRILKVDYLNYKFDANKSGVNLSEFLEIDNNRKPQLTNKYNDYKLNIYENKN
ncbi:MAG: hypothetical protein ACK5UE_05985 [Chitinophagales bacterium]|nr:hypothetical protein [Sphingobacteriales bacterium]